MPQKSALYGVARISCHEGGLLGRDKIARMAELTGDEAIRMLNDAGYGSMPDATAADAERMIENVLKETYALVREVTPDVRLTDLFMMKADVHNLKLLLKLRLTKSDAAPMYMEGGVYEPDNLRHMVDTADYRELPPVFTAALDALEKSFSSGVDPVMLSCTLDSAYIEYALSFEDAFALEYFKTYADFSNVLTVLRARAMGMLCERMESMLLTPGYIDRASLIKAYSIPMESLGRAIAAGGSRDAIVSGMDEVVRTGRISALEKARDNALIALASKRRHEINSVGPVVGYLLAREQEAKCVRLILTAKRNGLDKQVITERLGELYG